jgi:Protein of unknown function (DUF3106)
MYSSNFIVCMVKKKLTFTGRLLFTGLFSVSLTTFAVAQQAATPAQPTTIEKKSLVKLAEPLWVDLDSNAKAFLKALEPKWYTLSTTERKSWVALAAKVPKMTPAEQKKAAARVNEWAALTPEQRKQARENYRIAQSLPKEERDAQWEKYRSMTPAQRAVLRASGWTSNTAAQHAGSTSGLAKEAAQPLKEIVVTPKAPVKPAPVAATEAPKKQ